MLKDSKKVPEKLDLGEIQVGASPTGWIQVQEKIHEDEEPTKITFTDTQTEALIVWLNRNFRIKC